MELMYLLSITAAARTIDLFAAYFVPDELSRHALLAALKRGVRIRVIVPGEHIDSETVRQASKAEWGPLLAAGAQISEFSPTMFHCKVMIVDGLLVSVGSTNFDNRSMRLNDEATLNVRDADFAKAQTDVFEADLRRARPYNDEKWLERPWTEKASEEIVHLFGSQLQSLETLQLGSRPFIGVNMKVQTSPGAYAFCGTPTHDAGALVPLGSPSKAVPCCTLASPIELAPDLHNEQPKKNGLQRNRCKPLISFLILVGPE